MGRGRKSITNNQRNEWEQVFYNSVGHFVQIINQQLSSQYKLEPLSDHIKIVGGYAFKTSNYKTHGIPIIRISDFNNEIIDNVNVVFYDESEDLKRYELKENDIIIALTGGTIAKLAIVQNGLGKLYLNQRVGKFEVLKPEEFEGEYVYWIARSVQNIIKNLAWGAAIPNVSSKQIENLKFPFPPKNIQQGVIEFLNDLKVNRIIKKVYFNEEIENQIIKLQLNQINSFKISTELQNQLQYVKQLRQAFLKEAMQGKLCSNELSVGEETGQQLLANIKAEKVKLIKDKKLKKEKELPPIKPEEIPFEIPENWAWCRLGEISKSANNGLYKHESFYKANGTISLRMYNIGNGEINFEKLRRVKLEDSEIERYLLLENDILINRVNSLEMIGKSAIICRYEENLVYESMNVRLRIIDSRIAAYINQYLLMESSKVYFRENAKIANGQVSINQTTIFNMLIPLPPSTIQNQIVTKLNQLMKTCDELEKSIKQSQLQNEQLLQQVLREALEVKV